jgi:hypothetical protein
VIGSRQRRLLREVIEVPVSRAVLFVELCVSFIVSCREENVHVP